ncbi:hypothetical protein DRQ05_02485 [bacterium]|nr:MAG: hypothetical protein DRQ05_02485 [bacterium]
MRIVVVVPFTPWPIRKGTDRLIVNLLDGLSVRHEVTLVTMTVDRWELDRISELERPRVKIRAILAPHRKSLFHKLYFKAKNLVSLLFVRVPMEVSYAAPEEFLRLIAEVSRDVKADLILASYWHLYRLTEYIETSKLVLVTHDIDFIVNSMRVRSLGGFRRKIAEYKSKIMEEIEREAYKRYRTILTVTPEDAEILKRTDVGRAKDIHPLPLGIDLAAFDPGRYERESGLILMLGTFFSDFNRDAFRFFNDEVFPRIRREIPEAIFEVVGFGVDDELRAGAADGVVFEGGVDDVAPDLGKCSVMVLPLRFGGGVRIRMIEAAAMGTPVVSTPIGVAGLGLEPGKEYIEAESAEEMARAVAGLLKDSDRARFIGGEAHLWAEKNFSMETYPDRLDKLFDKIIHG